jgi:oxygen-independent coproporphyrinogen-3 oxidase
MASLKYKDDFIHGLLKEIELQKDYLGNETVETIYFGGGTPSMLPLSDLQKIFSRLYKFFNIGKDAEITLEANPDDLGANKIKDLTTLPLNRISLGTQSFQEEDLRYLHRSHSAEQAIRSVKDLQDAGFHNISIDLIFGVPTLSDNHWRKNLEVFKNLDISHLSAYALTVEPKTALDLFIRNKKYKPVSETKTVEQFNVLMNWAYDNDYIHYEISNYCKEGYYSKHNTNYWQQKPYLGLGPSAHSYNQHSRQWNFSNVKIYYEQVLSGILPFEREELNSDQKFNEYVMVSLRTMWGIDLKYVKEEFGFFLRQKLENDIQIFIKSGEVVNLNGKISLTKKGKLLADGIAADLFIGNF